PFDDKSKASFSRRYAALGRKWTLKSGTVVKDHLFKVGLDCEKYQLDIYSDDPSPFMIADRLSESWWQNEAWGVTRKLTKGIPNCKMLPGDVAGVESKKRQNRVLHNDETNKKGRARIGKKGDIFWRSFDEPTKDWAVIEAAKTWNIYGPKYIIESTSKLPRQLHDILLHRTQEVGSPNNMRTSMVAGLVIGGPVIQQVQLCWGLEGVNVTRFGRTQATRLESSVELFLESLDAIFSILLFRTAVLHHMEAYDKERKRVQQRRAATRRFMLARPVRLTLDEEQDESYMPKDLLYFSP
ncbi:hypothetical protein BGX21_006171, partial [Mortierella sp. AD011]